MKITILFLAIISLSFVASSEMCRSLEVKLYSSMQPISQQFTIDVKKIRGIDFKLNESQFTDADLLPIEQCGFVLEKTETSRVLDKIHHEYMRNEPESVWLPYSYTGDWSRSGYVIQTQLKRTADSKVKTPLVAFEFVNDFDLKSITSSDMDKFLSNLKFNSEKRKIIKRIVKQNVLKAQDNFSTNSKSKAKLVANNNSAKAEIITLKAELSKTIMEITVLTSTIKSMEQQESVKSAALSNINDEIDDIISKLVILNATLKKEEASLQATKPTDISQLQIALREALNLVTYPQNAPERFLEEYSIRHQDKFKIIQDNYRECVKDAQKIDKCWSANSMSSRVHRKLRRGFF